MVWQQLFLAIVVACLMSLLSLVALPHPGFAGF
jgi:hypothetical protein